MTSKSLGAVTCAFLLAAAMSSPALAQNLTCKATVVTFGEDVCSVPALRKLDEKLAEVLSQKAAAASDAAVKADQETWAADVMSRCKYRGCFGKAYEARLTELTKESDTPWMPESLDMTGFTRELIAKSNFSDTAYEFDRASIDEVVARMRRFESTRGPIAVAVVDTLVGEPIDQFAHRLMTAWNDASIKDKLSSVIVISIDEGKSSVLANDAILAKVPKDQIQLAIQRDETVLKQNLKKGIITFIDDIEALVAEHDAKAAAEEKVKAEAIVAAEKTKAAAAAAEAERLRALEEARNKENIILAVKIAFAAILLGLLFGTGYKKRKVIALKLAEVLKGSTTAGEVKARQGRLRTLKLGVVACLGIGCVITTYAFVTRTSTGLELKTQLGLVKHEVELSENLVCDILKAPEGNKWLQKFELRGDGQAIIEIDRGGGIRMGGSWQSTPGVYRFIDNVNNVIEMRDIKLVSGDVKSGSAIFSFRTYLNGKESEYADAGGGVAPLVCRGSGNVAKLEPATPMVTAAADPSEACRSRVTERFANSNMNPVAMAQALAQCGSAQGQRTEQVAQSREEKARAIIEKVRVGGPYCDGIAVYLEQYLDRGRWSDYFETLGKAQQRGCI